MKRKLLPTIFLLSALIPLACGQGGKMVTFQDICREEDRAHVSIVGYLRLPVAMNVAGDPAGESSSYQLLLVEEPNGTGGFLPVWARNSKTNEPNRVAELPLSYTYMDFRIFTDQGAALSAQDKVKLTGEISKTNRSCVLKIDKIQTP